jgi:peptidoglycan/LPS O-acetylase OafA/YrhL
LRLKSAPHVHLHSGIFNLLEIYRQHKLQSVINFTSHSVTEFTSHRRNVSRYEPIPSKVVNLDILRAVAVLGVFVAHLELSLPINHSSTRDWGRLGTESVIIFFLHTSLVLAMSMGRLSKEPKWIWRFYVRRIFRLYPLSMLFVLVAFVVRKGLVPATAFNIGSNLLLIQNFTLTPSFPGHLWSLAFEIDMYLLLPLVAVFLACARPNLRLALLYAATVIVAVSMKYYFGRNHILGFAPCFLGGFIALHTRPKVQLPWWIWPFLVAGPSDLDNFALL